MSLAVGGLSVDYFAENDVELRSLEFRFSLVILISWKMVAGAGFEPTTFGL